MKRFVVVIVCGVVAGITPFSFCVAQQSGSGTYSTPSYSGAGGAYPGDTRNSPTGSARDRNRPGTATNANFGVAFGTTLGTNKESSRATATNLGTDIGQTNNQTAIPLQGQGQAQTPARQGTALSPGAPAISPGAPALSPGAPAISPGAPGTPTAVIPPPIVPPIPPGDATNTAFILNLDGTVTPVTSAAQGGVSTNGLGGTNVGSASGTNVGTNRLRSPTNRFNQTP